MSDYGWKPYVSVAERRKKAEKAAIKAKKAGAELSPVEAYRGAIAKTFWGKAWCENLECYSDYANRIPRGRTYVRNGSVIDLKISAGEVRAQVMGSSLYQVGVSVKEVPAAHWQSIGTDCAASIDSLVELLQGKLSKAVMERICKLGDGLFPAPQEISFDCSCPDWASMCKHVAAVLYGIGARLDQQPELLFTLRRVDAKELVGRAESGSPKTGKKQKSAKVLDDVSLADVFGIEMAVTPVLKPPKLPKTPATRRKVSVPNVDKPANTKATSQVAKRVIGQKVASEKATVKKTAAKQTSVKKVVVKKAVTKKVAATARSAPVTKPTAAAKPSSVAAKKTGTRKSKAKVA